MTDNVLHFINRNHEMSDTVYYNNVVYHDFTHSRFEDHYLVDNEFDDDLARWELDMIEEIEREEANINQILNEVMGWEHNG